MDALLRTPAGEAMVGRYSRPATLEALREASDRLRSGEDTEGQPEEWILQAAQSALADLNRPGLDRLVNATGVVLHTNLGRAPLAPEALEHAVRACGGYSNLEFDLETGERGSRMTHVKRLLVRLTGAEDALVVNNCAAAVMLILDGLARGREVIVSRGELIEIGGNFRIPDVLERSGARLVEVGTTNRTRLSDYEKAITEDTGLLLSTHWSNFRIVGFTEAVPAEQLTELGRRRGVPTCLDLGSGLLRDSLAGEPTVCETVSAGFDLFAFSGDKLLGGPQAGIILGRSELVSKLARNPLTRALRVDKLVLSALEATFRLYLTGGTVPALAMLGLSPAELKVRADSLATSLTAVLGGAAEVRLEKGSSSVGGGSLPTQNLPTWLVVVRPLEASEEAWTEGLRRNRPPVVARRSQGALLLDPRTMLEGDAEAVVEAFARLIS